MPLFQTTQQQYYDNANQFTVDSTINSNSYVTLIFNPLPTTEGEFDVFVNGDQLGASSYSYNNSNGRLTFISTANPAVGAVIIVKQRTLTESLGNYEHITLKDIVQNFIITYVGEDKLLPKARRTDVMFHAQRGIQELNYDTLRSEKSQEIEIPPSLKMALPHDYVNYVNLSWRDGSGIEHIIYPALKTGNPSAILQNNNFEYIFSDAGDLLETFESETWKQFKATSSGNTTDNPRDDDQYDATLAQGRRYGLTPSMAQANGVYYIDHAKGFIHFSSDLNSKIITLKYISDGLASDLDSVVHKFAEDAIYKYMIHAMLAARTLVPEYLVARFKKEKFAAIRKAKIRLSNIKAEEISQVLRNKSKQIKH
tara:strand:+ start:662 stop:1765 length:1104 start_codon:yes stop_codon:yes gene_type:complete